MDTTFKRFGRAAIVIGGTGIVAVIAWYLFVELTGGSVGAFLGMLTVVVVSFLAIKMSANLATRMLSPYNVAKVSVEGPITRDGGGAIPRRPNATPVEDVISQIERADDDDAVEALLVHLNTPGGEVVPSDDVRNAVKDFEGVTVAYATDTCASGGYWIATACDTIVAREGSLVGSIGVLASRVTASELLDDLGLVYERLVAGEYKDAGTALRDMDTDERDYLQGIVDDYYESFVDRVTDSRDLDPETVRGTEAKVFLGERAVEIGLVDFTGTMEDVEDHLESELARPIEVTEFEPPRRLRTMLPGAVATVAYAVGVGFSRSIQSTTGNSATRFRFE
ncbi:MAG: signal peptide peptidase SppA [Halodesulfurarchaeum sp.]